MDGIAAVRTSGVARFFGAKIPGRHDGGSTIGRIDFLA
jgi:hypothetical protein